MKRSLPMASAAAILVALGALAGCGSAPSGSAAAAQAAPATVAPAPAPATTAPAPAPVTPAAPGAVVAGIPALGAGATDLKTAPMITAGTGSPPTTLLTQDIVVGKGTAAVATDTVDVRYSGVLYDGTAFDSSWSRGDAPAGFPLNRVVPGFAQGIEGMAPGGRRVIVIPPALGYGDDTNGPIPGGSTLVFVVDLVGIS